MFDSVRLRLTLWYGAVLSLTLIVSSVTIDVLASRYLYERLDNDLQATLEATVTALQQRLVNDGGVPALRAAVRELHFPRKTIAIFDAEGQLLEEKSGGENVHVRMPPFSLAAVASTAFYSLPERIPDSDDSCRGIVRRFQVAAANRPFTVVVNESLEPLEDKLDLLQDIFYSAVPLAVALAGVAGWLVVRRSLAPLMSMAEQAQRISIGNLEQQLSVDNQRDELGHLAAAFNALLTRLSNAFSQQTQFMADASHELRTPLSAIRTACAVMLQREDRDTGEYREALTLVEQQARRLTRIVEDMFLLARADAGNQTLQSHDFYLDELLTETAQAARVLAAHKGLELELAVLQEALFRGDEGLLRQMIWNLIGNAIKFTPKRGTVRVALESRETEYVITVSDTGGGILAADQSHIFQRFYRADQARSRTADGIPGGAGLGLSIAQWVARAHGGRVELERSDESGSTFVIYLARTDDFRCPRRC